MLIRAGNLSQETNKVFYTQYVRSFDHATEKETDRVRCQQ